MVYDRGLVKFQKYFIDATKPTEASRLITRPLHKETVAPPSNSAEMQEENMMTSLVNTAAVDDADPLDNLLSLILDNKCIPDKPLRREKKPCRCTLP